MKNLFLVVCTMLVVLFTSCEQNVPSDGDSNPSGSFPVDSYVVTGDVEAITHYSAVVFGEVKVKISEYDDVEYGVLYSVDKNDLESYHASKQWASADLLDEEYYVSLYGLDAETKYYYCAFVYLNNKQYKFGEIKSFTTLEAPPAPEYGDVRDEDPSQCDDTTEKCWEYTVSYAGVSASAYIWGTEKMVVETLQQTLEGMYLPGYTVTFWESPAENAEACYEKY